jgi:hypothetical protein
MNQSDNKPPRSRLRLWTFLCAWSIFVGAVITNWQANKIFEGLYVPNPASILVHFGITIAILSSLALVASYLVIHAWLNWPKTDRAWFWQGLAAIVGGCLASLVDVVWRTQSGLVYTNHRILYVFLIWSLILLFALSLLNSVRLFLIWLHSPKTYVLKIAKPAPKSWLVFWMWLGMWSLLVALLFTVWKPDFVVNCQTGLFNGNERILFKLLDAWVTRTLLSFFVFFAAIRIWRHRPSTKRDWFWLVLLAVIFGAVCSYALSQHHGTADFVSYTAINLLACTLVSLAAILLLLSFRDFFRWLTSWRIMKRCLLGLGIFLLTIALFYAEENWRGKRAWEHYKAEWKAKGESFDFKDFIPKPVPDDQNFALTPIVATSYEYLLDKHGQKVIPPRTNVVQRLMMQIYRDVNGISTQIATTNGNWSLGKLTDLKSWQVYYRTPLTNMIFAWSESTGEYRIADTNPGAVRISEFPFPPQSQSPASDVLFALSKYDSDTEELRVASRLTNSRFPLNYDAKPFQIFGMHLSSLKYCSGVLQLRVIAELEASQNQKALEDLQLMLYLLDSIRNEPTGYSQYQRIQMANLLIQPIWEGLVKHQWTDAQLASIEQELGELDFVADYQWSQRCVRNNCLEIINFMRTDGLKETVKYFKNNKSSPYETKRWLTEILPFFMPDGWLYRNQLFIAKSHERLSLCFIQSNRAVSPKALADISSQIYSTPKRPWNSMGLRFSSLGTDGRKFAYAQSAIDLARTACALERHHFAHGEYPETLADLQPEFIRTVPNDIIGGKPLNYRRTPNGKFLLYSVGWNEADDGGVVVLREHSTSSVDDAKSDWVWSN